MNDNPTAPADPVASDNAIPKVDEICGGWIVCLAKSQFRRFVLLHGETVLQLAAEKARADAAEARSERRRIRLSVLQWADHASKHFEETTCCPDCHWSESGGAHDPHCKLAAEITDTGAAKVEEGNSSD